MTAKDMAHNLINDFKLVKNKKNENFTFYELVQCAYITVYHILNYTNINDTQKDFWQEVKLEIDKLA